MLLTSPFLLIEVMHAKARRVVVRATLSVLLPLLRAAARALGELPSADADPNARVVEDPDLPVWLAGVSSLVAAERRAKKQLCGNTLTPCASRRIARRPHIPACYTPRRLGSWRRCSTRWTSRRSHTGQDALVRFSAGIRGTVRVLLDRERAARPGRSRHASIELEPATARESTFPDRELRPALPERAPAGLGRVPVDGEAGARAAHREGAREAARAQAVRAGARRWWWTSRKVRREDPRVVPRADRRAEHRARRGRTHGSARSRSRPSFPRASKAAEPRDASGVWRRIRSGRGKEKKPKEKKKQPRSIPARRCAFAGVWAVLARDPPWRRRRVVGREDTEEASWSDYS